MSSVPAAPTKIPAPRGASVSSPAAPPTIPTMTVPDVKSITEGNEAVIRKYIGAHKPMSVEQLLHLLSNDNQVALAKALPGIDESKVGLSLTSEERKKVVEILEKYNGLMNYIKKWKGNNVAPTLPALQVNSAGLHLLLANPMVAKVVMEQRKKQAAAGLVRAVAVPSGIFGLPVGTGLTINLSGGAMADNLQELDDGHPIEMRGAGYALAAMRGGAIGGNVIFGTQGTTMWRPIDDNSFISQSLELAIDNLKAQLSKTGSTLDGKTEDQIRDTITDLKKKEDEVKQYRDQITAMNNAISVGSAKFSDRAKTNVDLAMIQKTAEAYNNAMKSRQKIEGKLLRVVVALGGKVAAVNVP